MRRLISALAVCAAPGAAAEPPDLPAIIDGHILSGYRLLVAEAAELASVSEDDCSPTSPALRSAYHDAFDAWLAVSHLRFGPSEDDDRAFALAFWPDPRGSTPKALSSLLREEDPAAGRPENFRTVSVAARGFHALEFLLFDPRLIEAANTDYGCALVRAIAVDIAGNAVAILNGWESGYADLMARPGNETYRSETEVVRQLFTALSTGLQFTSEARLGRPMGTIDRPRPKRAEARRSGRSLRHVMLSLRSARDLAALLSGNDGPLDASFVRSMERAGELDDPVFAGVSDPQGRLRVEILQQDIDAIRQQLTQVIGPRLGITAGFNSLDGD